MVAQQASLYNRAAPSSPAAPKTPTVIIPPRLPNPVTAPGAAALDSVAEAFGTPEMPLAYTLAPVEDALATVPASRVSMLGVGVACGNPKASLY